MLYFFNFLLDNSARTLDSTLKEIAQITLAEYEKCETAFKQNGDKAWKTATIRRLEVELINASVGMPQLKDELEHLQKEYKVGGTSVHLAFVNAVLVKYHIVDYYQRMGVDEILFEKTYKTCSDLLIEIRNICISSGNEYGLFRANFMQEFLDLIRNIDKPSITTDFQDSLEKIKTEKYTRESEMISYIRNIKEVRTNLAIRFFMYYPIVLQ